MKKTEREVRNENNKNLNKTKIFKEKCISTFSLKILTLFLKGAREKKRVESVAKKQKTK